MKLRRSMLFLLLMSIAVMAHAGNKDAQFEPLRSKIIAALKAGKTSDALAYMAELEGMEHDLSHPLPEGFYFYYIDTLDKAGDRDMALRRGKMYLDKFGQNGKHYNQVNEIVYVPVMVRVPGKSYEMGKYDVTQAQWQAVMGNNPSSFKNCGDTCPVEQVSWNDVQQYLQKLNAKLGGQYRLPTEEEWEYACYGGSRTEYCGGNDLNAVAWYKDNSNSTTHPVGQKQANDYGLYDMSGNVWQWMENEYNGGRALRGGSWVVGSGYLRAAYRGDLVPAGWGFGLGFRLARTLP